MKEPNAMSLLPTTCPGCRAPEVFYSTGVLHNTLFTDMTSPVVRCLRCHADFFALPPDNIWTRCYVNALIVFTRNPQEIDMNHTLAFRMREDGFYNVYPTSENQEPGSTT
jgi:hypothetical protein